MNIDISILDRLKTQHLAVSNIIATLNNQQILNKPFPDKWSIKDNIAHLARYQLVFLGRLDKILSATNPTFEPYKAEDDNEFKEWQNKQLLDLLTSIQTERQHINDILINLNSADLTKTGEHLKYGILNVLDWIEFFLLHEAYHLFTIFQLAHTNSKQKNLT